MNRPIYILGTGLSHNGSTVLLKDGAICVAIEKERISRIKHDGNNDTLTVQYCLEAEGISLNDIDLVVQCANFDIPDSAYFGGPRLFGQPDGPPVINISHHLAHAYSAVGTCHFDSSAVMVIDGCGSPVNQFLQLNPDYKHLVSPEILSSPLMYCEKDSFYHFDGQKVVPLLKDFSELNSSSPSNKSLPTTQHSIGGFYAYISNYVFGNMDDVGKLMGLAPFGKSGLIREQAFRFENGLVYVKEEWKDLLNRPSVSYDAFKSDFQYYADIACWAQEEIERAIFNCIHFRLEQFPHDNLCYSGGVALNAVANAKLINKGLAKDIYIEPAAADNGLALGCAYYGWMEHMGRRRKLHDGSTCFGKSYSDTDIDQAISETGSEDYNLLHFDDDNALLTYCARQLNKGKTVAWFQGESEFGPRALGRRSILAHPGIARMKDHINANIKFREDFRPFAPAVLKEKANEYFENGLDSPYMILVDRTKEKYRKILCSVTHVNGTARTQTVEKGWNEKFYNLIDCFYQESGIPVLLNTSLNRKGMPIVETPMDAINLFNETDLDILVMENTAIEKKKRAYDEKMLNSIISFLSEIDIEVKECSLSEECLIPGFDIGPNYIKMDRDKVKYPGDLLHEAGHLAMTPPEERPLIGTDKISPDWPTDGDEIGAILWSYAALTRMGIDPKVVFHESGYKDESDWIIESFKNETYIGLPLLEYRQMAYGPEKATELGVKPFPHMVKWM